MLQGTELLHGTAGPWITIQVGNKTRIFNLRHIVRDRIEASDDEDEKRALEQWLRDREAEGEEERVFPPPGDVGERMPAIRGRSKQGAS